MLCIDGWVPLRLVLVKWHCWLFVPRMSLWFPSLLISAAFVSFFVGLICFSLFFFNSQLKYFFICLTQILVFFYNWAVTVVSRVLFCLALCCVRLFLLSIEHYVCENVCVCMLRMEFYIAGRCGIKHGEVQIHVFVLLIHLVCLNTSLKISVFTCCNHVYFGFYWHEHRASLCPYQSTVTL